jgi:hypothetical protein
MFIQIRKCRDLMPAPTSVPKKSGFLSIRQERLAEEINDLSSTLPRQVNQLGKLKREVTGLEYAIGQTRSSLYIANAAFEAEKPFWQSFSDHLKALKKHNSHSMMFGATANFPKNGAEAIWFGVNYTACFVIFSRLASGILTNPSDIDTNAIYLGVEGVFFSGRKIIALSQTTWAKAYTYLNDGIKGDGNTAANSAPE